MNDVILNYRYSFGLVLWELCSRTRVNLTCKQDAEKTPEKKIQTIEEVCYRYKTIIMIVIHASRQDVRNEGSSGFGICDLKKLLERNIIATAKYLNFDLCFISTVAI